MAEKSCNCIIFDWFSMTSKIDSFETFSKFLGLDHVHWSLGTGHNGYRQRYYFESISIHFDGNNDTVWLEMTGQGCRAYETYSTCCDWYRLFALALNDIENYHLTRLDVAYDDWSGVINIKTLDRYSREQNIVTKFRDWGVDRSYVKDDITLYYGSKQSDVLFRCYNKAAERNREDVEHWIRFEMQLRNDRALSFLQNYQALNFDIGKCFFGVLKNYIRFVKPSSDSNKSRWKTAPFWSKFLGSVEKISLFTKKDIEYNILMLKNYAINQAGNAVDALIQIEGIEGYYKLLKERQVNPNPKYQNLVDSELQLRLQKGEGIEF